MALLALLFEHREGQRERRDVRDVRDVGCVQVVFLGVHVDRRAAQRAEDPLDDRQRVLVAADGVAQHDAAPREGAPLSGFRAAVLRAPHRVCGDEAPAVRVHRDHLAQLAFDRTHVHHHLLVVHAVEGLDGHQRNGVGGGGQHHEVRLGDALFERHHAVRQPQLQGFGGVFFGVLHPEYLLREFVVAQGQGERASDEAHARNQYFHSGYTYL